MTTDIFAEQPAPKLEDYVGEGKKYADGDAVAKALAEKDAFILRLQQEAKERADFIQKRENERAFEDQMRQRREAELNAREEPNPRDPTPPAPTVTPVDIETAVQKAIEVREQQNSRSRNLITVRDRLTETLGPDYAKTVKQRASELQVSTDHLNELAATAPNALFALLGLDRQRTVDNPAPPRTSVNPAAFSPHSGKRDKAYYDKLKKENPALYLSPKIQMQEYNDLKAMGPEAFGL